jgi:hypothetical protein
LEGVSKAKPVYPEQICHGIQHSLQLSKDQLPMLFRSSLVCLSVLILASAFWMLSCASSVPSDHLTVHTSGHPSNVLHVDTCVSGASASEVYLDAAGKGKTSLCPETNHAVELDVVDGDHRYRVTAAQVQIQRTGDGIATSVEARLTP